MTTLTKETLVHIGVLTAVTGAVFAVILSSGTANLNELEIQVFGSAKVTDNLVFLQYSIHNTGDYEISNVIVSVTADCCKFQKMYNGTLTDPLLKLSESKEYLDTFSAISPKKGDDIVVQFEANDILGNRDVDIMTVRLD